MKAMALLPLNDLVYTLKWRQNIHPYYTSSINLFDPRFLRTTLVDPKPCLLFVLEITILEYYIIYVYKSIDWYWLDINVEI